MINVYKVKRTEHLAHCGATAVTGGSGGFSGDVFREHLGRQLKEEYRRHIDTLFDELTALADTILSRADLSIFERYRGQLRELLTEATKNAYILNSEYVTDLNGRQRVFATISIIDSKLDDLAKDILHENSGRLDYLSRVDEIRGLILDMLL
jgi:uncharacterized protein YaaR (DUF327 family)